MSSSCGWRDELNEVANISQHRRCSCGLGCARPRKLTDLCGSCNYLMTQIAFWFKISRLRIPAVSSDWLCARCSVFVFTNLRVKLTRQMIDSATQKKRCYLKVSWIRWIFIIFIVFDSKGFIVQPLNIYWSNCWKIYRIFLSFGRKCSAINENLFWHTAPIETVWAGKTANQN